MTWLGSHFWFKF